MAKDRMNVLEPLRMEAPDADLNFLREGLRVLIQAVMEAESGHQDRRGPRRERSSERITYRNGHRAPPWDTRVGALDLQVPQVREGSYFPSLLEPRRRSERVLLAVVQPAYVEGVSTRRVEDLVQALGCEGISKSQVSRICRSACHAGHGRSRLNRCRGFIPIAPQTGPTASPGPKARRQCPIAASLRSGRLCRSAAGNCHRLPACRALPSPGRSPGRLLLCGVRDVPRVPCPWASSISIQLG